jgi:3-oxoacyl-[acyl-carrier protein] reductase
MRNVIVTGGSRGLGLGIARRLHTAGYRVIAISRSLNGELSAVMEKAEEAFPGSFHFVACDLGEIEHIPQLVKDLEKSFGPIYGLVNNAGISFEGVLAMMPVAQIEKLVRVNTISPIVLTKHVVRSMMASGVGRIVNVSSVVAFTGYNGLSVYSATKASLTGFSRSLAREVGRAGVTVNSVAPGFVDTDMTQGMTKEQRERLEQRSALRRLVQVEDVASAVEFLIGDGARNITGTVITVDAGNTA